ncbi:MAG TPA: 2'-5' RNA ligase family protein [Acidimicrobiia bacterium]|nr:2'-5' RNA ligase family protein [Acidimicrobiia bacterium]
MSEPAPPLESALLVPVPEAEPCVQKHRFRHDSVALLGVPAHITVLYPFMTPDEISDSATAAVERVLEHFPEFPFLLTRLEHFPEGATYLAPEPAAPFVDLTMAIAERFPEYPPYGGAHADVIPHLTVAQTPDAPADELAEIERHLPIRCVAREAWLMVEDDKGRWHTRTRFALARSARA